MSIGGEKAADFGTATGRDWEEVRDKSQPSDAALRELQIHVLDWLEENKHEDYKEGITIWETLECRVYLTDDKRYTVFEAILDLAIEMHNNKTDAKAVSARGYCTCLYEIENEILPRSGHCFMPCQEQAKLLALRRDLEARSE